MTKDSIKLKNRIRAKNNREKRKESRTPTRRDLALALLNRMLEVDARKYVNGEEDYSGVFESVIIKMSPKFDADESKRYYEYLKSIYVETRKKRERQFISTMKNIDG